MAEGIRRMLVDPALLYPKVNGGVPLLHRRLPRACATHARQKCVDKERSKLS
jgi:hypothetical protein